MYKINELKDQLMFRKTTKIALYNTSSKKYLCNKLFGAQTLLQRACGLQFRKLRSEEAMIFFNPSKMKVSLHMFFVFKPIDVIFGNIRQEKDKAIFEVVRTKEFFKPFSFTSCNCLVNAFIELPIGVVSSSKTIPKNNLIFKASKDI